MGLNCTHGCWDGPYSHFNKFREWIAKQIGFELRSMIGFGGVILFSSIDHPIKPLLDHSDCDGQLTPDECLSIVKGGQMILDAIDMTDGEDHEYWYVKLQLFINGCRDAAEKGEPVKFG